MKSEREEGMVWVTGGKRERKREREENACSTSIRNMKYAHKLDRLFSLCRVLSNIG